MAPVAAAANALVKGELLFDGARDYIATPLLEGYDLGAGDYTISAWIRYDGYPWRHISQVGDKYFVDGFLKSLPDKALIDELSLCKRYVEDKLNA